MGPLMAAESYPPPDTAFHPSDWLRDPCSLALTLGSLQLPCLLIQAKLTSQLAWFFYHERDGHVYVYFVM